jgi:hypothetical protein
MANQTRHKSRSGNPAIRAGARGPSAARPVQNEPVTAYEKVPLPGILPPTLGVPRGKGREVLALRLAQLEALEAAARAIDDAQLALALQVASAREAGVSWHDIGDAVGLDRETVRRRFTVAD